MVQLLNCILLIFPQSIFSPHFYSQPPHAINILDDAKKLEKMS